MNVVDALALDLEQRGYGIRDALARALRASAGAGAAIKTVEGGTRKSRKPAPKPKGATPAEREEASRPDPGVRACAACGTALPAGTRADAEVCPKSVDPWGRCRKALWRQRRAAQAVREPQGAR